MQNFTLLEKIGSGSYSTVYRAKDLRTHQTVALKIMKFPYSKGKRLQDMELAALKKFRSNPCVIQLLECFMVDDVMHMVFELGGLTLIDYYRRHEGKFTEEEVKVIGYQIALALQDMHRCSYMHRDLKPENIMIDPETKLVKLVDFGLCKKWESNINTNYVTTRWYRSPELILNLPYGVNIDVFSLGCVMLELYLGYEAFPGKDAIDQLNKVFSVIGTPTKEEWPEGMKHLEDKRIIFPEYERTDLHSHIPAISEEGVELIESMIACNYRDRISSKEALEHPYFRSMDVGLMPEVVQKYIKQIRPPVIQYPLKLNIPAANDKLKSGSTDASTSRKVLPTKRKLELVSSLQRKLNFHSQNEIEGDYNVQINGRPDNEDKHNMSKQLINRSFAGFNASGSGVMQSQSTRAKKKLNLTILDQFHAVSVKNNTLANLHHSEAESEETPRRQKSQPKDQTNRHQLYKYLMAFDHGVRLGEAGHSQSFLK